jgi:hypothetical protein
LTRSLDLRREPDVAVLHPKQVLVPVGPPPSQVSRTDFTSESAATRDDLAARPRAGPPPTGHANRAKLVHNSVPIDELDVRRSAMAYVAQVSDAAGGVVTRAQLEAFRYQGQQLKLIDHGRGIRKSRRARCHVVADSSEQLRARALSTTAADQSYVGLPA